MGEGQDCSALRSRDNKVHGKFPVEGMLVNGSNIIYPHWDDLPGSNEHLINCFWMTCSRECLFRVAAVFECVTML